MKRVGTLCFIWLIMAMCGVAQPANDSSPPVLDTTGKPLETGIGYYVLPGITDVAGGLTLIDHDDDDSCPLYVGQEPLSRNVSKGFPVIFRPYATGETIIRESRDLSVEFQAVTVCTESTAWRVDKEDPESGRRLIATGGEKSYFKINNSEGVYSFAWCPTESCPNCARPRCGDVGILIEDDDDDDEALLALDGRAPAFPFVFERA